MSERSQHDCTTPSRSRRLLADHSVTVVGLVIGVLYLVFGLTRGDAVQGVVGLGVMLVYVLALQLWRRRSETAQLLGGAPADERQDRVVLRASAFTGQVLSVVVVAAFLVSLAVGSHYAVAFGALGAVDAVAYIGGTAWFSRHT